MTGVLNDSEIDKLINLSEDEFLKIIEIPDGYDSDIEGEDNVRHQHEILGNSQASDNDPAEEIMILMDAAAQQLVQLEVVNSERNENVMVTPAKVLDETARDSEENSAVNQPDNTTEPSIADPQEAERPRQFHRRTVPQNWKFRKTEFVAPVTKWLRSLPPPPENGLTPFQYFKSLFSDDLVTHIAEQSGIYAMQKDGVELIVNEMVQFLGILLYMGICRMLSIRLYWSNECIKCTTQEACTKCDVNLCVTAGRNCFMDFHTKK